jgi:hypothetical protein
MVSCANLKPVNPIDIGDAGSTLDIGSGGRCGHVGSTLEPGRAYGCPLVPL